MSEKYKVIDSTTPTFITTTLVDWVDLLVRPIYCNILDESINYCIKEKGWSVHAYVYMSSHIHLIVTAFDGELQNVIHDFKKFTSNIFYIEVSPLAEVTHGALKKMLLDIPNEQRIKNWMDFTVKLKIKCLENNILEPFSIGLETFGSLTRITGVHTPDGYHFYRDQSELIRLDLAKWIKKNKKTFAKTPKETWLSLKNNGPYDEDLYLYDI